MAAVDHGTTLHSVFQDKTSLAIVPLHKGDQFLPLLPRTKIYTLRTAVKKMADAACDTKIQQLYRSILPELSDTADAADLVPLLATVGAKVSSRYRVISRIPSNAHFELFKRKHATSVGGGATSLEEFLQKTADVGTEYVNAIETYLDRNSLAAFITIGNAEIASYRFAENSVVQAMQEGWIERKFW